MNSTLIDRSRHFITMILAFGTALCGAAVVYAGYHLQARAADPYKRNLDALANTIKELDKTLVEIHRDVDGLSSYLGILSISLKDTEKNLAKLNKESTEFIELVGTNAPKLLADSVQLVKEASKTLGDTANQAGQIPTDPLKNQRAAMYGMAGTLTGSARTLGAVSSDIANLAKQIGNTTSTSIVTAETVVASTDKQINMFQDGSLKHVPAIMKSLSAQMNTHLLLIESSYDLLHRVTVPIIAIGLGFLFIGMRSMLLSRASHQSLPLRER